MENNSSIVKKSTSESTSGPLSSSSPATRTPLAIIGKNSQNVGSENEMVGRRSILTVQKGGEGVILDKKSGGGGRVVKLSVKGGKRGSCQKKLVSKAIQAVVNEDLEFITGDEPPPSYWKQLAETRQQALEDALMENETLHQRIEILENSNHEMQELLKQANELSHLLLLLPSDDEGEDAMNNNQIQISEATANESGFGGEELDE